MNSGTRLTRGCCPGPDARSRIHCATMDPSKPFRADQCWQDKSGEAWVAMQDRLDQQLDPFGRAALARLSPRPGERALDIGCGAGQTLLELGEAVGATGRVLGVDLSEPMIARARERIAEKGYAHVNVELGDAATHPFQETFDVVFSRFGVMFFSDPVAAFHHVRGALRPGGRLSFVCWQSMAKNAWASLLVQAVKPLIGTRDIPPLFQPGKPGPFFLEDSLHVRRILTEAGFEAVETEPLERDLHLGGSMTLDEAVEFSMKVGPAARILSEVESDLAPKLQLAIERALAPFATARGVWLASGALVVTARVPG